MWPATAWTLDRPARHERNNGALLVALACGQQEDDGLAATFAVQVELGAEATAAAAERLLTNPPFPAGTHADNNRRYSPTCATCALQKTYVR